MDSPAPTKAARIKRWLPYWAVLTSDLKQTLRSWVYVVWVLVSVLAAVGSLLYHVGIHHKAGIIQPASALTSDLLRYTVFGSVTLIIVLTAGCISSERGTLADSILSRGISRYQYFLAKWHARLVSLLGTFLFLGAGLLTAAYLLLHEDLSLIGSALALVTVVSMLAAVISLGVTVSAISNSTLAGIAILWIGLYGTGFTLSLLPARFPSPDRLLNKLTFVLQGHYDWRASGEVVGWSALVSCAVALVGLVYFARRDV